MKNVYLIDYENVGMKGLEGIENLKLKDRVALFHYDGAGKVKYDVLQKLAKSPAMVSVHHLNVHTKNAMDFHICTMLGSLVTEYGKQAEYHIISNDKGYDAAIECIAINIDEGIKIDTLPAIKLSETKNDVDIIIKEKLGDVLPNKIINKVIRLFNEATTEQEFHTGLQRLFKDRAGRIYKALKPLYANR